MDYWFPNFQTSSADLGAILVCNAYNACFALNRTEELGALWYDIYAMFNSM
uniref:Uncharacterized protein n=1 Tax=Arundo donax TaxID=35708 RepID=A0A0A9CHE0_ARUDO